MDMIHGNNRGRARARLWMAACVACCGIAALPALPAVAQPAPAVTFSVQPQVLQLGETASIRFEISGIDDPPVPTLPTLPDFQVDGRPSRGMQTQVVNGRLVTSTVTYSYRIMPRREGTFQIGPLAYRAGGRSYTLPPVQVQVAPRNAGAGEGGQTLEDLLFARLSLSKESAYVQEAVDFVISVYSRQLDLGQDYALNDLPQAGITLGDFRELGTERELVNGQVYAVRRFHAACRGLTAGRFRFEPTLSVPVRVRRQANSSARRTMFDQMFMSMAVETRKVDITPDPLTFTVLPLPTANQPPDFSGAVGAFEFFASAQPREVGVGSPITITMEIRGQGNLDAVSAPRLDLGDEFKLYDARLVDKRSAGGNGAIKTFEQVVIPRVDAVEEIPRLTFSYFDPEEAAYRTLERGPFRIVVKPSSNTAARIVQADTNVGARRELEVLEADIAYLKPTSGPWRPADRTRLYRTRWFLGMQTLPPLCALLLFAIGRRRDSRTRDHVRSRRRRAPRQAEAKLRQVRTALKARDNRAFSEAVWDALATYFADRLNLSPGEITGEQVAARFARGGMPEDDLRRLRGLFDRCEQSRFGLGASAGTAMTDEEVQSAEAMLETLETIVEHCEDIRI